MEHTYPVFTKDMVKDYKILAPTMLPMHFRFLVNILHTYGYDLDVLETRGRVIIETGLRYVHNDTCYPAIIVIGQFINALQSGRYDPHRTALMITQTGGGCRASNYLPLLRKALEKAGFGYVPVISLNIAGLEKNAGFRLTLPMIYKMMYAVLFGDLLMCLRNQCRPYETQPGASNALAELWTDRISDKLKQGSMMRYSAIRADWKAIIRDFASLPREGSGKVRVGIVGEIYVKYSPLGNNDLEQFLLDEGAEPVVPGLMDFLLYCVFNNMEDKRLYGLRGASRSLARYAYAFLTRKQQDMIRLIRENSDFAPIGSFRHTQTLADGFIHTGVKMGEGWLLTAEMVELIESGVKSIVCAQPFGCLPNHIIAKGMMKPIREAFPDVNLVAVDYDAGATKINQENRIKLMLANSRLASESPAANAVPDSPSKPEVHA